MLRTAKGRFASLCVLALALLGAPRRQTPAAEPVPAAPAPAAVQVEEPPPPPAFPSRRTQIGVPENNPLELYPPRSPSLGVPLTVALHGRDMDPIEMCDGWNDAQSLLVCPAGNTPAGDSFDWGGSSEERLAALDAQLAAVDTVYGPLVDHGRGDVLVGFSRGGFLARDLVYARPGRFQGMVLLGAAVKLDAERLRASGIRRVLLAAGEHDEARPTMERTAQRLASQGVPARFVGLGPIWHQLPTDLGRYMRDALAWVRQES